MLKIIEKSILEELINKGFSRKEIGFELGLSKSSVDRLYTKFSLKSKFNELKNEILNCLECGIEFKFTE